MKNSNVSSATLAIVFKRYVLRATALNYDRQKLLGEQGNSPILIPYITHIDCVWIAATHDSRELQLKGKFTF